MEATQSERTRGWGPSYVVSAALLLVLFAWTFASFWTHPEDFQNWRFLCHDLGNQLHLNDELIAGKRLYADVFSQYGPASAKANAAVAFLFGNSARNFLLLQGCFAVVCTLQGYALLRRSVERWWAILWTGLALMPWMPSPAGGAGSYLQPYGGLERIVLLGIALAWRPLTERTRWRNLALGLLLGCLPWIKFGGAFVAGASLLLTDVIVLLWRREFRLGDSKTIVAALAWIIGGFLIGQGALVLYAVLALPGPIAKDVVWPWFMLRNYSGYVTSNIRFLHWQDRGYFLGAQVPIVAAILSVLGLTWRLSTRKVAPAGDDSRPVHANVAGGFLFLFWFWYIGLTGYLAHVWLIMGYAWMLMPGAGYAICCLRRPMRLAALFFWLPCFVISARALLPGPSHDGSKPMQFRNGEILWLDTLWRKRVRRLTDILKEQCGPPDQPTRGVMAFSTTAGIAHYFGYPVLTRQSWFMPGFVRPYDENAIRESLGRTGALIIFLEKPGTPPFSSNANEWGLGAIFSTTLASEIADYFGEPLQVDPSCWVLRPKSDSPRRFTSP